MQTGADWFTLDGSKIHLADVRNEVSVLQHSVGNSGVAARLDESVSCFRRA
jgi:hypothetical protein